MYSNVIGKGISRPDSDDRAAGNRLQESDYEMVLGADATPDLSPIYHIRRMKHGTGPDWS